MGSRMVVGGVGNDLFSPDREITRAEFISMVVKAVGLQSSTGSNPFGDVEASDWYGGYIQTAYDQRIISGYDNNKFGPMDKINRQEAMAVIAKAMGIAGLGEESLVDQEKILRHE